MTISQSSSDERGSGLRRFSEKSRQRLLGVLKEPGFGGQIPASEVKALADIEGRPVDDLMAELLPLAQTFSRPPLSNYRVGAVVRGASGSLYMGANIEIAGQALGFVVHAEQSALSSAYMHDEQGVASIAVSAAPCGLCRQFLTELSPEGEILVLIAGRPAVRLSSLLPMAFGPKDLGLKYGAFPVRQVELALSQGAPDALTAAALAAARKSYAPYTKAHSGIAIGTQRGRLYTGSYIENAAFNPSLPPFQIALAALILAGEDVGAISRVVLVEVEGAPISHKSVTDAVLGAIAPAAKLEVTTASMRA
jgi:cytidine deaminase